MKILHITPDFQHPKVRGPDRHYRFLRELSRRHEITLLTLVRHKISAEALDEVSSYANRVFTFNANGADTPLADNPKLRWPVFGNRRLEQSMRLNAAVRRMKETFDRLTQREAYDVVLFHGKSVFPVIESWGDLPIVVDFCDATSMRIRAKMSYTSKARLPLLGLRYWQVREVEQKMVRKTPHLAFISYRDREAILGPEDRSEIIPNGLDLQYWRRRTHTSRPHCLVFTGVMNYAPNEDAALYLIDEILPRLKPIIPDIEILIVGRDPTPALLARDRRHPEVTVTGFVDDMRDYVEQATIFAAPVRFASGMQNKIQEALAMEIPVVTTSIVADGMRLGDGEGAPLYVADDPQEFAEKVIKLLHQKSEQARLVEAGRRFAEKYFDWARSAQQLEQMCIEAVTGRE